MSKLAAEQIVRNVLPKLPAIRQASAVASPAVSRSRTAKKEGDISSVFASLSGDAVQPLPPRFAAIKQEIVGSNGEALQDSWSDLLRALKHEIAEIKELGAKCIPSVEFSELATGGPSPAVIEEIRRRGVCIVRGVFKPEEALNFKAEIREYIRANPSTKAFPPDNPQVFELYWSPSQIKARADPRMTDTQRFLLSLWHDGDKSLSSSTPLCYADRLRIRQPGDARFALGPHVDGGGVERWEDPKYRRAYDRIFAGRWRDYDPFEVAGRDEANMNLYETAGGCSVLRAWQGWLAMSTTGPSEGTLRVFPLSKMATSYWLLRPFFSLSSSSESWAFDPSSLFLHGATPGRGQELNEKLHPHLELDKAMVSMPTVQPGDTVWWHGDSIHAVESVHKGRNDSSVMYIPSVPHTKNNLAYIQEQAQSFLQGIPPPDFPGGLGESLHTGRADRQLIERVGGKEALASMGLR